MDICWHEGLLFLTTHTGGDAPRNRGCLSVWDAQGSLLCVHSLASHRHPNGLAVFTLAGAEA
jgi:hypothetical protein